MWLLTRSSSKSYVVPSGIDKDDIGFSFSDGMLIIEIEGARSYRKANRLPFSVVEDNAMAAYRNGVPEVAIRKKAKRSGSQPCVE